MSTLWRELATQVLSIGFVAGVLGNLAAAALCGAPALWHLYRKLDAHHAELMRRNESRPPLGGGRQC
jgi:hypothetical protein